MRYRGKKPKQVSDEMISVRTPKDFPWKILSSFVQENGHLLGDSSSVLGVCRNRDIQKLERVIEEWSPQNLARTGALGISEFACKYQVASLLKKYQWPGDRASRRSKALEGFKSSEAKCHLFNTEGYKAVLALNGRESTRHIIPSARRFVQRVLGEVDVDRILLWARHGPGATLATRGGKVSRYNKYADLPYSVTERAYPYARLLIWSDERWRDSLETEYRLQHNLPDWYETADSTLDMWIFDFVPGNRIEFVPKDAKKERPIAIEPLLNLMIQLGVDGYIRRRLKRFGCDLDDQSKNQRMAKAGSISGSTATLDLSAASDSISLGICRLLLPEAWYQLLLDLRSPKGIIRETGEILEYKKISSMGNGYTFALESLVFLALCYAVCREDEGFSVVTSLAVYGDDLIVPIRSVLRVRACLETCGFSLNMEKSFYRGSFRESCGCDYYRGTNVRPIFLKEEVNDVHGLFSLINRSSRAANATAEYPIPITWLRVRQLALPLIPPSEVVDSYLHVGLEEVNSPMYRHSSFYYRRLVTSVVEQRGDKFHFRKLMHTLLPGSVKRREHWLTALHDISEGGNSFVVFRRGRIRRSIRLGQTYNWPLTRNTVEVDVREGVPFI
jgi:hypothetical protein